MIGLWRHLPMLARLRQIPACLLLSTELGLAVWQDEPAHKRLAPGPGAAVRDTALPGVSQRALHMRGRRVSASQLAHPHWSLLFFPPSQSPGQ